jgi:tetratricopeptide (TPR) repeat protein
MERYEDALADFNRAIELKPNYTWTIAHRGETYRQMERYQDALADFDRAIELKPNDAWTIARRGETYRQMERYQDALADFNQAIELEPKYEHEGRKEIGLVLLALRRYEAAAEAFLKALVASSACSECWESLARAYEALHSSAEVPRLLREVSVPDADSASVIACRAEAMRVTGHRADALADFNRAIELKPNYTWTIAHRGETYWQMERYEDALADFNQAIELKPNEAWIIADRGETYRQMGRYDDALADFDRAIALDETVIKKLSTERGLVLSYLARYAEAIESYGQGLAQNPDAYACLYNIAVAMARWKGLSGTQTQITRARASLLAVVNTDSRGAALYGLGGLEAIAGNDDQALSYLGEAIMFEKEAINWARHDVAWLNLRADARFQSLISGTSRT